MTGGVLAATTGFATHAGAVPVEEWEMPDVKDMVLQQAVNAIYDVTGPADLEFDVIDEKNGQDVINQTNWTVCDQYPRAGLELAQGSTVTFYVKRFNQQNCFW